MKRRIAVCAGTRSHVASASHASTETAYWGPSETLETLHRGEGYSRVRLITLEGKTLLTPAYIVSYSSHADPEFIGRMTRTLSVNLPVQAFLLSAYDYLERINNPDNNVVIKAIRERSKTRLLILDSGSYEIQSKNNVDWDNHRVLNAALGLSPDIVVAYDPKPPNEGYLDLAGRLFDHVESMREALASAGVGEPLFLITFILRPNMLTDASSQVDNIVRVVTDNSDIINVVGFPDVDIHAKISDRLRFCARLRSALDGEGLDIPIHVFGCSELLSIVSYSYCGAELFDGSGWWRRTLDSDHLGFVDEAYLEYLGCNCPSCDGTAWRELGHSDYGDKLMLHNLLAFDRIQSWVREAIEKGGYDELFARSRMGDRFYSFVKEACENEP